MPPTNNAQFEFGVLKNQDCLNQSCEIIFTKHYTKAPLVFLLSSFDASRYWLDKPSVVILEGVTHTKATIRQTFPLNSKNQQKMKSIHYVVMEEGITNFDPNKTGMIAQAGKISGISNVGVYVPGRQKKWLDVDFYQSFAQKPIVFTQIQGVKEQGVRATTANSGVGTNSFKTALELGRSRTLSTQNETIAYLAVQPFDGVTSDGVAFSIGSNTFSQNQNGLNSNEVLEWSCDNNEIDLPAGFSGTYSVLMSKQTRNGSDGGWLRICEEDDDEFSFIFEEDNTSRKHGRPEIVGYLVFEDKPKETLVDLCEYFPEPVQSWDITRSIIDFTNSNSKIIGWSSGYEASYLNNDELILPFHSVKDLFQFKGSCVTSEGDKDCVISNNAPPQLISTPNDIVPNWNSGSLNIQKSNYETVCENSTFCSYPDPSNKKTISIDHSLDNLTVSAYGISFDIIFQAKKLSVKTYNVDGSVNSIFKANSTYTFDRFIYSGTGAQLSHEEGVTLNIVTTYSQSTPVEFDDINDSKDFFIYGPKAKLTFKFQNHNELIVYILADEVEFTNKAIIRGGIASNYLKMTEPGAQVIAEGICSSPPQKNYTLKVTPQIDYSLTCERIPVTFTVEDDNGPVSGFNKPFSAVINAKDNGAACWSTLENKSVAADCSITGSTFVNGEKTLYLGSSDLGVFDVTASSDGLNETTKEHFEFVPFKFNVNTVKVIANKPQSFDVSVLACNDGSPDVVQDYSGNKELDVSPYILDVPNSYEGIRTDLELAGKINPNQIGLTFNQGIATTDLTYSEAGAINFTLSDPSFTCPVGFDCNDYPVDSGLLLSAVVNIESRPWKLVVCSDKAIDGDSSGGSAFIAAGERFSVKVKPVRFGTATDLCQLPVTQNFFKSSAPFSSISPSYELSTPTAGVKGTLAPLAPLNNDVYVDVGRDSYYEFNNMIYSEVGSLLFKSEALSPIFYDGIQGGIEFGELSIGRFYPAYFTITDTLWDYPKRQGSSEGTYAYMDQPFEDVTFEVTAYSTHGSTATNYGLFDTNLKASFELTGDYHERLNIAPSDLDNTHWSNATWETPDLSNSVIWSRKSASMLASNVTTTADGPFNEGVNSITTGLNLAISGVDPVSFDKNQTVVDQELLSQPDVRYGRMVLDSVGAAIGQSVTIPLRVEYWNGTGFVISDSDNATTFNGANYYKQTIWPDPSPSSNSALSGSNLSGIDSGIDRRNLKAIADTNNATLREQVRFWLKLTNGEASLNGSSGSPANYQPWLQYNWRGKGDEDPSTVVTFGIYRGNDRIIFRGESNIIGTSN